MLLDKSIKILVAEDDYLVSEEIIRSLRTQGYNNIIEAADGEEAYERTRSQHPDVVLMDIMMPKLDGLGATRKIQECCPTPIVILSAYETPDAAKIAGAAGVSAYLTKPPRPGELERAMAIAMARHADLMELRRLNRELETLSLTDEMTGLHNRRGFFFLAEKLMTIAKRQKKRLLMLYADLDGLKIINDTRGHQAGDSALIETSGILKATFRESDIIARIGGDEFVILQIETANNDGETAIARLQQKIDASNSGRKKGEKLSISVGVSHFDPEDPYTIDVLLSKADSAMYEMKKSRRKL